MVHPVIRAPIREWECEQPEGSLDSQQRVHLGAARRRPVGVPLSQPGLQAWLLTPGPAEQHRHRLDPVFAGAFPGRGTDQERCGNWRLHLTVQAFTFAVFPLVGLAFHNVAAKVWLSEPEAIQSGFLYLCVLPSTVSTSVVLTAVAHGNTAGALFNAAFSNILGVFLTPVLVQLLMKTTGESTPLGPLLVKITALTLAPFFFGMLLRNVVKAWLKALKPWVARISNTIILFIVYTAFCDSVSERIWETHGFGLTVQVFLGVALLFTIISGLVYAACRALRMNREDLIAAYFCSVKKTLAMGVPLAMLIFGARSDLSLILLPIMLYHPLQLLVNGIIANQLARSLPADA